jgi:hypothetical protein
MLVLKPEKIFEKCLLTKGIKPITQHAETFSNNDLDEKENFHSEEEIACVTDIVNESDNSMPDESIENTTPMNHPPEAPEAPEEFQGESEVFSNNINALFL